MEQSRATESGSIGCRAISSTLPSATISISLKRHSLTPQPSTNNSSRQHHCVLAVYKNTQSRKARRKREECQCKGNSPLQTHLCAPQSRAGKRRRSRNSPASFCSSLRDYSQIGRLMAPICPPLRLDLALILPHLPHFANGASVETGSALR